MDYSEIEIFFSRASYCDTDILKLSVVAEFFLQMSFTGILGVIASFRIKFFVSIK